MRPLLRTLGALGAPLFVSLLGGCSSARDAAPGEATGESEDALGIVLHLCAPGFTYVGNKCVAAACAPGAAAPTSATCAPPKQVAAADLRYDQVQQVSSHNAYETSTGIDSGVHDRKESLFDQLAYHHVRSLEIDLHRGSYPGTSGSNIGSPDFFVYHEYGVTYDSTRAPSCDMLSVCLAELKTFHDRNPSHEPITVWLEPKDGNWVQGHLPSDLDGDLIRGIGRENIFAPSDLMGPCPGATSLQDAVAKGGWPTLESMRGKFIFAVMETSTTGSDSTIQTVLSYQNNNGADTSANPALARLAFIAPDPVDLYGLSNAVFANMNAMNAAQLALTQNISSPCARPHMITRANTNDFGERETNQQNGVLHLATEFVNVESYPAFATHNSHGWPFAPVPSIVSDTSGMADDEWGVHLAATSGDIENTSDSFGFAFVPANQNGSTQWAGYLAGAADSGDEWAKGCLMARATLATDSPYFAVCRPNGAHTMRVQYRLRSGARTSIHEFGDVPVLTGGILSGITGQMVNGQYCVDGWVSGGAEHFSQCFATPLYLHGIASAAHGGTDRKFFFGSLARTDANGVWQPVAKAQLSLGVAIGAGTVVTQLGDTAF